MNLLSNRICKFEASSCKFFCAILRVDANAIIQVHRETDTTNSGLRTHLNKDLEGVWKMTRERILTQSTEAETLAQLGKMIEDSRVKQKFTLDDSALRLGKSKSWVSKVENGKIAITDQMLTWINVVLAWDSVAVSKGLELLRAGKPVKTEGAELLQEIATVASALDAACVQHGISSAIIAASNETPAVLRLIRDYLRIVAENTKREPSAHS